MKHSHPRAFRYRLFLIMGLAILGIGGICGAGFRSFAAMPGRLVPPTPDDSAWSQLPDPFNNAYGAGKFVTLAVAPDGTLYAGGIGGVSVSSDGGQHWNVINKGLTNLLVYTLSFNTLGEPVAGVGFKAAPIGVFRYTQGSWHEAKGIVANRSISQFTLDRTGALIAVTGWAGDVFRSTDNGDTFRKVAASVGKSDGNAMGALWQVHKAADGTLYTGGEVPEGIYRSTDNGTIWQQDGLGKSQGYTGNLTCIGSNALGEVFAARTDSKTGAPLQRRTPTGWVSSSTGLPAWHQVRGMVMAPSHDLYLALTKSESAGGVYHSTDNGKTWKRCFSKLPYTAMGEIVADNKSGAVYVLIQTPGKIFPVSIYKSAAMPGS